MKMKIRIGILVLVLAGIFLFPLNSSYSLDSEDVEWSGAFRGILRTAFTNYSTSLDVYAFDPRTRSYLLEQSTVFWSVAPTFHIVKANEGEISPYVDAEIKIYGENAQGYDAGFAKRLRVISLGGFTTEQGFESVLNLGVETLGIEIGDLFSVEDLNIDFNVMQYEKWMPRGAGFDLNYTVELQDSVEAQAKLMFNMDEENQDARPSVYTIDPANPYPDPDSFFPNVIRMDFNRPIYRGGIGGKLSAYDLTIRMGGSAIVVGKKRYGAVDSEGKTVSGREIPDDIGVVGFLKFQLDNFVNDTGYVAVEGMMHYGFGSPAGGYDINDKQQSALYGVGNFRIKIDNWLNKYGLLVDITPAYVRDGNPDDGWTASNLDYTSVNALFRPYFYLTDRFHLIEEVSFFGKQYRNSDREHTYDQTITFKSGFQFSLDDAPMVTEPNTYLRFIGGVGFYNYKIQNADVKDTMNFRAELSMSALFD